MINSAARAGDSTLSLRRIRKSAKRLLPSLLKTFVSQSYSGWAKRKTTIQRVETATKNNHGIWAARAPSIGITQRQARKMRKIHHQFMSSSLTDRHSSASAADTKAKKCKLRLKIFSLIFEYRFTNCPVLPPSPRQKHCEEQSQL